MRKTLVLLFGILVPAAMIYIAYTGNGLQRGL